MSVKRFIWGILAVLAFALFLTFPTEARAVDYVLGEDSQPQEGVPKGTVTTHTFDSSEIYPGTTTEYWVYVPAQYEESEPACVMVFQDGAGYVHMEGSKEGIVQAPIVFDNLIHKGEMPVTIGIFIDPSKKDKPCDQRTIQYAEMNDTYARFLLEEILPEVGKDYNLIDDRSGRAICGMSDGGVCSFTVVWERPDAFSKAITHVASYARLEGGSRYPYLIRNTRGNPKPIRVFLQASENDINILEGNWTLGNLQMESALMFARYDYQFVWGFGGHDTRQGGAIFPDTLRWLWRDYPGVKGAGDPTDPNEVVGEWDVVTNIIGIINNNVLTVSVEDGGLVASLHDEKESEVEISNVTYEDGVLSYEYLPPASQIGWRAGLKAYSKPWTTWLKVSGGTFKGALTTGIEAEYDFSLKGRRKGATPDAD
jgi:enterochelin esterase family protein